jgi:hypothetical protein
VIGAQVVASAPDLGPDVAQQCLINELALAVSLLVQVQDLDEVGLLTGQLLIAHGVNVQLIPGYLLSLHPVTGFEVDNRRLVGVEAPDQINPAIDPA